MVINFVYDYKFIEACVKLLVTHPYMYFPDILKNISVQAEIHNCLKVTTSHLVSHQMGLFLVSLETFLISLENHWIIEYSIYYA